VRRYQSLEHFPHEARGLLVEQFHRDLKPFHRLNSDSQEARHVDSARVLAVLFDVSIEHPRAVENVRLAYEAARRRAKGAPEFNVLVERHIVRIVWGIAQWSWELGHIVGTGPELPMPSRASKPLIGECLQICLQDLVKLPYGPFVELGPSAQATLQEERTMSEAPSAEEQYTALRNWARFALAPGWIASRLWKESEAQPSRLRWWFDRVNLLSHDANLLDEYWSHEALGELSDEILRVLRDEIDLLGWDEERERYQQSIWMYRRKLEDEELQWPDPPPADAHDRLDWLERCERHGRDTTDRFREEIVGLTIILACAVTLQASHAAPHPAVLSSTLPEENRPFTDPAF
jgi:hypothetical protein